MRKLLISSLFFLITFNQCHDLSSSGHPQKTMNPHKKENLKQATFSGGCFWCMEPPFEKLEGVLEVISGYTGGDKLNPTYEQVGSGKTNHLEAIQVTYDESKVSYKRLLEIFWQQIDPTDNEGQFVDRGHQYTTAIFYHDEFQKKLAQISKEKLSTSGRFKKPIVTPIRPYTQFYHAEDYHQNYYKNNSLRYKFYRYQSGRDKYLEKKWQDIPQSSIEIPSQDQLKKILTPLQYQVTQEKGTEPAFNNEFWDHKKEGIYVDIVSGEPLFSSKDKYDSKTGWPSFTKPIESISLVEKEDRSLFTVRTEVRSKISNSHLGHVFLDGPPPTGLRYCINSASLRFISKEDLEKEKYEKYQNLF